ncbi:MAG: glycosyltransferase family 1 protein, partial [Lachnospiraceae bacterium]|nr:glycosyltransferase family 1 protein [Lachnospiraceae bacterium]
EAETYADYYLSHEKERQQIAANALGKILEAHTFEHRIQTMLSVIDGQ